MDKMINIKGEEFRLKRERQEVRASYEREVSILRQGLQAEILKLQKKRDDRLQELAYQEGRIVATYQLQKAALLAEAKKEEGDQP